jgi:hypothetical protein
MKKVKPVKAWSAVRPNGTFESADENSNLPYLYSSKKAAKQILPDDWRIARVEIREIKR